MKPKLFQYTLKDVDFFYSKDFDREATEDFIRKGVDDFDREATEDFIRKEVDDFSIEIDEHYFFQLLIEGTLKDFLPPKFMKLVNLHSKQNGLERIAILNAHGGMKNNKWSYSDVENLFSVQSWVNKMDGKYKILLLKVCNEEGEEISSKRSIICHPNEIYSSEDQRVGEVQVELFIPGIGYVDNYSIDSEIEKLKNQ